jgi:hypothetical protein
MFAKAYVGRKRRGEAPSKVCLFSIPSTNPRVPHITRRPTLSVRQQLSLEALPSPCHPDRSDAEQRDLRSIPATDNAAVRPPPLIEPQPLPFCHPGEIP